jgi:hypothetical protein
VLLACVAGCGGPKLYPVQGKVEYTDGKPATDLVDCKVEFESIDGKIDGHGVSAQGAIQLDGTFHLTTLKPNDGALLGGHRVLIMPPVPGGDAPARPHALHPRYADYETSGLTATVEAKVNAITLTLERRKR